MMIVSILKVLALLVACFLPQAARAASSGGAVIEGQLQLPDGSPFNITTPVMLNHGEFTTYSKMDGSFVFRNVPPGVHSLDVQSITHHFGQIKIRK